jgi:predicted lipoprotein with Yx(FWY)xxD motif
MRIVLAGIALAAVFASAPDRGTLIVRPSDYGPVLFDGRGYALYAFTKDPKRRSTCFGACAAAWPPYLVARPPRAGRGVKAALLGTIKRAGRLQVTYNGRPLYYYRGDSKPGEIRCQNVLEYGGLWLVARANGTLVR